MTDKSVYLKEIPDVPEFKEKIKSIQYEMIMSLKPFHSKYGTEMFMNCLVCSFSSILASSLQDANNIEQDLKIFFNVIQINVKKALEKK